MVKHGIYSPEIETASALVTDLSHDGKGVVKLDGRVYFVPGALPGEVVEFVPFKKRRGKFSGKIVSVESRSPDRVEPECEYFGICGGCTLQHLAPAKQLEYKQKMLLDNLNKIGRVLPEQQLPAIAAEQWNYRRKARPGCKFVPKKGGILIGFREQGSSYLTSLKHCSTLDKRLSNLLDPLHVLIAKLSCFNQIPQLEIASADNAVALVLRHLSPLSEDDCRALVEFAQKHSVQFFLQPGGLNTVTPLWPEQPDSLYYLLTDYDLKLEFSVTDFIQVNARVNQQMIAQALVLLELVPEDNVLDLFCGLGNFTLPMAQSGARIMGVEGEYSLVSRARANAELNGLKNVQFEVMNLHKETVKDLAVEGFNKILLDPPRSGALEVVTYLVPLIRPEKIIYISCNPSTLARDAEVLVHQHGYRMIHAGAIDMFPHTSHIESMGVFVRP